MFAAAAKTRILIDEIRAASRSEPLIMVIGAFLQTLTGVARLIIFMIPLKAVFLKLSGVKVINIPGSTASISVDALLVLCAVILVILNCTVAAIDFHLDTRRRSYISAIRASGESKRANNIGPFYTLMKSFISFAAILPILLYMDLWFTFVICIILAMISPLIILSRRLSANSEGGPLMKSVLNSKTTGAFSLGIIIAAAIVHISNIESIDHTAAIYLIIYFLLLRQLASAVQRAADGFHKVRI